MTKALSPSSFPESISEELDVRLGLSCCLALVCWRFVLCEIVGNDDFLRCLGSVVNSAWDPSSMLKWLGAVRVTFSCQRRSRGRDRWLPASLVDRERTWLWEYRSRAEYGEDRMFGENPKKCFG